MDSSNPDVEVELRKLLCRVKKVSNGNGDEESANIYLKEIITFCSVTSEAKDVIRKIDGLSFLVDLVCSTTNFDLLEYGLKALLCTIDLNSFNQREVTKKDVFVFIRNTLVKENLSPVLLKSLILLTSTLLYQNVIAQNIIEESDCLQCFIDLYEELFPPFMLGHVSMNRKNKDLKLVSLDLWQLVNNVLCFAMANPVHALNQEKCSMLLPVALKILELSSYSEIVNSVCTFLCCLIMENSNNLVQLVKLNGLYVFKHCLERGIVPTLATSLSHCADMDLQATIHLVDLIDLCINENENNAAAMLGMDVVTLLTKLLLVTPLNDICKTKILLTLGHFVEACPKSITNLLEDGCFITVLEKNSQSDNYELIKTCQYLIHLLLMQEKFINSMKHESPSKSSHLTEIRFNFHSSSDSASCVTELYTKKRKKARQESSSSSVVVLSDINSKIELAKTKEERIRKYLASLENLSSIGLPNATSKDSSLNSNVSMKFRKSMVFNKNFGTHELLTNSRQTSEKKTMNKKRRIIGALSDTKEVAKLRVLHKKMNRASSSKSIYNPHDSSSLHINDSIYTLPMSSIDETCDGFENGTHIHQEHDAASLASFLRPNTPQSKKVPLRQTTKISMVYHNRNDREDLFGKNKPTFAEKLLCKQNITMTSTPIKKNDHSSLTSASGNLGHEENHSSHHETDTPSEIIVVEPTITQSHSNATQYRKNNEIGIFPTASINHSLPSYNILVLPSTKCSSHGLTNKWDRMYLLPKDQASKQ